MKSNTLLLVLLGLAGAFLLYLFSKKTTTGEPYGIVGASTTSEYGSNSGILTPVSAISAAETGLSSIESILSGENSDFAAESSVGSGDLGGVDISDDTSFED